MESQQPLFAIVDIETTGGSAAGSRITEIAILIHNGKEVIHQYETLVNPLMEIPVPIFALTGIDNEMVKDAPVFEEIAAEVFGLLENRIFVAHNVNFDYSFVRHQLEECGYKWSARKLCTVRMSRKIRPGLFSYSLGNLCDSLCIPVQQRHRAGGDAAATAVLFTWLLEWDTNGVVKDMLKKTAADQRLPPNLPPEDFVHLPSSPGVYYFRNREGKVIYVGKAVNIKKRVATHFTGNNINPQRQHFLREIYGISYEICATELMALLLECVEIKRLWPRYNRALKRFEPRFGLLMYEDRIGYKRLVAGSVGKQQQQCVYVSDSEYESVKVLRNLMENFQLDPACCSYGKLVPFSSETIVAEPVLAVAEHNRQVDEALGWLETSRSSYAIVDKGRTEEELSCIWLEKGAFYAMGYISIASQLTTAADIRDSLQRYHSNYYMQQLIENYAKKYPGKIKFRQEGE